MSNRGAAKETRSRPRSYLSLREAIVLADVSERVVRKDIETGVLTALRTLRHVKGRLQLEWRHVYVLAAAYGNSYLNSRLRRATIEQVEEAARTNAVPPSAGLALDKYIRIDWNKVRGDVEPRIALYEAGLKRIETKAGVLGGDVVFRGTRLPVAHVGKMLADGETAENILDDYPTLTPGDLAFAELYHRAHPPVGRPRRESVDAAVPP